VNRLCSLVFFGLSPMYTRSRAGLPRDHAGGLSKGGSKGVLLDRDHLKKNMAVDEQFGDGRASSDDNEVSCSLTSPCDSDNDIGGVEKSGVIGGGISRPAMGDGGPLADKVFDDMPQSCLGAEDVNRSGGDAVRGNEKGKDGSLKAPWVNLFKDNRNVGKGIKLDAVDNEGDLVLLDDEDVDVVDETWGFCLVGYFAGRFPGMAAVQNIREGWKVNCTHWFHSSGWIVFKFTSDEDRMKVLHGGPYFAYGRNLLLRILPKCFRFGTEESAIVPTWIKLPNLPLDCWNVRALSKIVSKVGKPITTDKLTLTKERLSYARVLVEVDASKDLTTSVDMRLPTGEVYQQSVIFEFTPKYCNKCKRLGHADGDCNMGKGGKKNTAYEPNRKFQTVGGTASITEDPGRSVGGASETSILPKRGETVAVQKRKIHKGDGSVGTGQTSTQAGRPVSCGKSPVAPAMVGAQPVCGVTGQVLEVAVEGSLARDGTVSVLEPGIVDVGPGPAVDSHLAAPAEGLDSCIGGGAGPGPKGKHKRGGQQVVPAVKQHAVAVSPNVKSVRGDSLELGDLLLSSGGKVKGGSKHRVEVGGATSSSASKMKSKGKGAPTPL